MYKTKNIGRSHGWYNHQYKGFSTQVLVVFVHEDNSETVVAQFYGMQAKIIAADFVERFNMKSVVNSCKFFEV
jgi:hypothetical protein